MTSGKLQWTARCDKRGCCQWQRRSVLWLALDHLCQSDRIRRTYSHSFWREQVSCKCVPSLTASLADKLTLWAFSATDSSAATASDPASSSSVQGSPSASSVSASAASASSSTTPNGATVHRLPGLQEAGALAAAAVGILLFA